MGNSSSTRITKTGSTPSFGRLKFSPSPRLKHRAPLEDFPSPQAPTLSSSSSLNGISRLANERTTLIPPAASNGRILKGDSPKPLENEISMDSDVFKLSPPLMVWIGPALACALAYALYNIFIKKGSDSIHPILGGVILQIIAALLGAFLLLIIVAKDGVDELQFDQTGIFWSVCAGLAVGAAEMLSFFVMGMGAQAMQVIPVVIGGSVMFGTVLGWCWLHEVLSLQGWAGVVLITGGIAMVATDPGSGLAQSE